MGATGWSRTSSSTCPRRTTRRGRSCGTPPAARARRAFRPAGSPSRRCSPPPSACCTRRRRIERSSRRSCPAIERWHAWLHRERRTGRLGSRRDRAPVGGGGQLAALRPRAGPARRGRRRRHRAHATAARSTRRSGRPTATTRATCTSSGRCERGVPADARRRRAVRLRRSHLQLDPRRSRGRSRRALGRARRATAAARAAAATRIRDALASAGTTSAAVYVEDDSDAARRTRPSTRCSRSTRACRTASRRAACSTRRSGRRRASGPRRTAPWAVTTASKSSPAFDPRRYWRGPVWVNINWFFVRGLERAGLAAEADELRRADTRARRGVGLHRVLRPDDAASRSAAASSRGAQRSRSTSCTLVRVSYDPEPRYPVVGGDVLERLRRAGGTTSPRGARRRRDRRPGGAAVGALRSRRSWRRSTRRGVTSRARRARFCSLRGTRCNGARRRRSCRAIPSSRRVFEGALAELFDELPQAVRLDAELTILLRPRQRARRARPALVRRRAEATQPRGDAARRGRQPRPAGRGAGGSEQRLLFVDWPLLDRHKQALAGEIDLYVDLSEPEVPRSLDGEALRRSLHALAGSGRSARARPSCPARGAASGSATSLGDRDRRAEPRVVVRADHARERDPPRRRRRRRGRLRAPDGGERRARSSGPSSQERFGASFPIRFDYLDTLERRPPLDPVPPDRGRTCARSSGSRTRSTRPTTSWTRAPARRSSSGCARTPTSTRSAPTPSARSSRDARSTPSATCRPIAAEQHRLYLIPAGTPHASGAGNVVLEISATPYLYTLRFYDWLRRDLDGELRPVHVEHAFANLDPRRRATPSGAT